MLATIAQKTALTGIKTTGAPHIGNYLGMIQPALELVNEYQALYFLANYHALTTLRDGELVRRYTYEMAASWLALGLEPKRVLIYRQSDVPEITEMAWVLACSTAKGLLNRAHAYKAAVDANEAAGHNPDDGVNVGLYNYPVLMAADILLFGTHVVPVGQDQRQHIEIARDIAITFNNTYGDVLVVPEAAIKEEVKTIPGVDGRKMSKSYGNTIQVFAPPNELRKSIMRIVTDSKTPDDPKNPDECNIFAIYQYFAAPSDVAAVRERYFAGGVAYGAMKQTLFELLDATFAAARQQYQTYLNDKGELDRILRDGAEQARSLARPRLDDVRARVGV
jgi:tryptophanyl-tRNA synthetase